MSNTISSTPFLLITVLLLCQSAYAFGAGNIPEGSGLEGWVWKHGDIGDVLAIIPVSFLTKHGFTKLEILQVYFGNWLRDYSQLVDITPLKKTTEPTLRAIVSVLGFMKFGIATEEFDVTKRRLGCYRPEEHIDNPRGYAVDSATGKYRGDKEMNDLLPADYDHKGLRREVAAIEFAIDPQTGMKNYIANEKIGIATSASYIRGKLQECIHMGRSGRIDRNNEHRKEAFIHLGALLHTLEDFAAHSNYVELVLLRLGEKDVFPYVGDQCKVTVPVTGEQVPPVVTGTFGSLDIFQSIIGEVDDKAAMQNRGLLGALDAKLAGLDINTFKNASVLIAGALKYVVALVPGASDMPNELQRTIKSVTEAHEDPKKYDPARFDISQGAHSLWAAIEPILDFHGKVKRFLIDYEEELEVPIMSAAKKQLDQAMDLLVYSALAVIIEPAVQQVREAIKYGKETIESLDRQNAAYIDLFDVKSEASDPSHSILAKDHFSNYLNPVAGRVSTATTNWATQRIVECWDKDNDSGDAAAIESILKILHHPAFAVAQGSSDIQQIMFDIVESWWRERSDDQRGTLRKALSKGGIHANADGHMHGDNNAVFDAAYHTGSHGFAVDWKGSKPVLVPHPEKTLKEDLAALVENAGKAIERAQVTLTAGADELAIEANQLAVELDKAVDQGIRDARDALAKQAQTTTGALKQRLDQLGDDASKTAANLGDKVAETVNNLPEKGQQVLNNAAQAVDTAVVKGKEVYDEGAKAAEEAAATTRRLAEEAAENTRRLAKETAENAWRSAEEEARKAKQLAEEGVGFLSSTGKSLGLW